MNRLNLHHLYIFWIFGKSSSFTQAASDLSIAQSAVTAQIRQLEEHLDLSLVNRTHPRRPQLTAEGKRVLDYAQSIFETSQELINWSRQGPSSTSQVLRIGALSGLSRNLQYEFIKPLLRKPEFRFQVTTGDQKNLLKMLLQHDLDVVLSSRNVDENSAPKLSTQVLTTSPLVVVEARERSKRASRSRKPPSWQSGAHGRDIFLPGQYFEAKPELDAYFQNLRMKFRVAGEIDDIALLRILALRSGSLVVIPLMGILQDLKENSLIILTEIPRIHQRFYAITQKKLYSDPTIQRLIESLQETQKH